MTLVLMQMECVGLRERVLPWKVEQGVPLALMQMECVGLRALGLRVQGQYLTVRKKQHLHMMDLDIAADMELQLA